MKFFRYKKWRQPYKLKGYLQELGMIFDTLPIIFQKGKWKISDIVTENAFSNAIYYKLSTKVVETNHIVFNAKRMQKIAYRLRHHGRTAKIVLDIFRCFVLF